MGLAPRRSCPRVTQRSLWNPYDPGRSTSLRRAAANSLRRRGWGQHGLHGSSAIKCRLKCRANDWRQTHGTQGQRRKKQRRKKQRRKKQRRKKQRRKKQRTKG